MFRKTSAVVSMIVLIAGFDALSDTTVRFNAIDKGTSPSGEAAAGRQVDQAAHDQFVQSQNPKPLRLDFLDVGQGDSILVSCPNGRHVLVDCGSLS